MRAASRSRARSMLDLYAPLRPGGTPRLEEEFRGSRRPSPRVDLGHRANRQHHGANGRSARGVGREGCVGVGAKTANKGTKRRQPWPFVEHLPVIEAGKAQDRVASSSLGERIDEWVRRLRDPEASNPSLRQRRRLLTDRLATPETCEPTSYPRC